MEVRTQARHMLAEVVLGYEFEGEVVFEDGDIGMRLHLRQEGTRNLTAGGVGGVHDAVRRMPALAPEVQRTFLPREPCSELD